MFVCTLFAVLLRGHYGFFLIPYKKSLLKSSYQKKKKYLPEFFTQKISRIEKFKPKKILWSSSSLEIRSAPPWGSEHCNATKNFNRHRTIARKVNKTPSPQHLFLALWFVHQHLTKYFYTWTIFHKLNIKKSQCFWLPKCLYCWYL